MSSQLRWIYKHFFRGCVLRAEKQWWQDEIWIYCEPNSVIHAVLKPNEQTTIMDI